MRKFSLLLLTLSFILFTNCKKDNNKDKLKPVPLRIIENTTSSNLFNFEEPYFDGVDNNRQAQSSSTVTFDFEYFGRLIVKKIATIEDENGTNVYVSRYYYNDINKGLLDSIVVYKNYNFFYVNRYTIVDKKITQISRYNSDYDLEFQKSFSNYNGDKPYSINIKIINIDQNITHEYSGSISYDGNDVSEITMTEIGTNGMSGITYTKSYDHKHALMLNVETKVLPYPIEHNIVSESKFIIISGQQTLSYLCNCTYTYNKEGYPVNYIKEYTGSVNLTQNAEIVYEDK